MSKVELTPKGKPKDGFYYPAKCPKCGDVVAICIGKTLICQTCHSSKGVELKRRGARCVER